MRTLYCSRLKHDEFIRKIVAPGPSPGRKVWRGVGISFVMW
jgi:hypothetical protein